MMLIDQHLGRATGLGIEVRVGMSGHCKIEEVKGEWRMEEEI